MLHPEKWAAIQQNIAQRTATEGRQAGYDHDPHGIEFLARRL